MVTNPIKRVRHDAHDTPLDLDVGRTMVRLAALPPSVEAPYVTLSLDWRPAGDAPGRAPAAEPRPSERRAAAAGPGPSRRPSWSAIERELAELVAAHGPRGAAFDSLSADADRIAAYLEDDLDPAAQGVFLVACAAAGVFEPLALGLPVPTRLVAAPTPALGVLARLVDDHPPYGVLLADQHEATLSLVSQANFDRGLALDSTDYPRKQQQGGWSQRRFQARADERVAAFARGIADEVQGALDAAAISMLVLAGDEVITSALDAAFHPTVKERVVATLRLDIGATEQEVVAATLPVVAAAERTREDDAIGVLRDAMGAGGFGVAGIDATLLALQGGQVSTLLINDDYAGAGWADYGLPVFGSGPPPSAHPAGGDPATIVPVALEDELVRLALATGAAVQVVHASVPVASGAGAAIPEPGSDPPRSAAAAALDEFGGVAALLRFSLDRDHHPASE
jgi:hypothetical protein